MHVQSDEDAAFQHALVESVTRFERRDEGAPDEDVLERCPHFLLPRNAQRMILQYREHRSRMAREGGSSVPEPLRVFGQEALTGHVKVVEQRLPAHVGRQQQFVRLFHAIVEQLLRGDLHFILREGQLAHEEPSQRFQQLELVADGKLDVDTFDPFCVVAHPRQRNHHVLVDLERVRMLRDGCGAGAVEPELLARFAAHGDEAFAAAAVGNAHDMGRGLAHGAIVVAHDVRDQHHLRQPRAPRLRGITHGLR